MEVAPVGTALGFEVTFDSADLNVAMSVYDITGSSPVLVQGPTAMDLVSGFTYSGTFTGSANKIYTIIKAVYTDDTFTTLSPSYSQGSESIVMVDFSGGGSGSVVYCNQLLGFIDSPQVVGYVNADAALVGVVNC